jgi:hypothetical protein
VAERFVIYPAELGFVPARTVDMPAWKSAGIEGSKEPSYASEEQAKVIAEILTAHSTYTVTYAAQPTRSIDLYLGDVSTYDFNRKRLITPEEHRLPSDAVKVVWDFIMLHNDADLAIRTYSGDVVNFIGGCVWRGLIDHSTIRVFFEVDGETRTVTFSPSGYLQGGWQYGFFNYDYSFQIPHGMKVVGAEQDDV